MKILILGGNGFIGKNLAEYLKDDYEVFSFDREIPNVLDNKKIKYIKGDFFNDTDILPYLKKSDVVVHAISTINPGNSNEKYFFGYKNDFLQSIKLCEWSKQYEFRILFLSSGGTVYGNKEAMPIKEEDLPVPINHYGNLKLCIENTIRTFNRQMGLNNIIARISNPYGPGQDYRKGVGFIDAALKKAINKELDEISEYKDKKFKDSKLQELAISYINELNNGLEIAKTYGSDSFETKWDEHIGKRTSLLSAIDKINSIPVQDKDSLSELLAQGNEVKDNNAKKEAIENLVKNINFTVDNTKSNEYTKYYSATVENTTEYLIKDIYLTINLVNADGVTVGTQYVSANNWAPSGKTLFEFSQFKGDNEFTTTQVSISSFNAEKTE